MKSKALYEAILVATSLFIPIQAFADPVTLVCVGSQLTWTIVIDAAAGSAEGFRANFTDQNIGWHNTRNGMDYNLNRVSGVLLINGAPQYTCHAGQKQF